MIQLDIGGRILARNTILNLGSHTISLVAGIITIPFIIRGLGTERFGVLSLIWIVFGYFTIFDLGLGKATTKYVAESLGRGQYSQVSELIWTTVVIQVIMGIISATIVASFTPFFVDRLLKLSPELHDEAKASFYLLSLAVPVILISSSFSGLLEAAQRFDLTNTVRIPSSIFTFLIPFIGGFLRWNLSVIVSLLILQRIVTLIVFFVLAIKTIPIMKKKISIERNLLPSLFVFGGWVTVATILTPVIRYLDRFMIGSLISAASITFYSTPFDMVERLWVIPNSLALTLFPAFSTLSGLGHQKRIEYYFLRSMKFLIVFSIPLLLLILLFAKEILAIWLGAEFVQNSLLPFRILLIGAMIGIVAPITGSVMQGCGRPDIIPKIYIISIPLNVILVFYLTKNFGIIGAALSYSIRTFIETVVLMIYTLKIIRSSFGYLAKNFIKVFTIILFSAILSGISIKASSIYLQIIVASTIILTFTVGIWYIEFSSDDKVILKKLLKSRFGLRDN